MDTVKILPCGDRALTVSFGEIVSPSIAEKVQSLKKELGKMCGKEIIDMIPSYAALTILFDAQKTNIHKLSKKIEVCLKKDKSQSIKSKTIHIIPVCYGGEFGPDLLDVANFTKLTEQEVVQIHTQNDYLIYMIGFLPGFPYLGGMDEKISMPRLATPRTEIPSGSVGIGGKQTGIYPLPSPGGWRLIGKTPLEIYRYDRVPPVYYEAGDYIRFQSIPKEEYFSIEQQVKQGKYIPKKIIENVGDGK